jgi:hypothetical protein
MSSARSERLFTFSSGGWVLLLAVALTVAGTIWNLAPLADPKRIRPRGDGRSAASYGFDLTTTLVPASQIVSGGMVTDALPPLYDPRVITLPQLSGLELEYRIVLFYAGTAEGAKRNSAPRWGLAPKTSAFETGSPCCSTLLHRAR